MCQASARQARQRCIRLLGPKVENTFASPRTRQGLQLGCFQRRCKLDSRRQGRIMSPGRSLGGRRRAWQCALCCHQAPHSAWGSCGCRLVSPGRARHYWCAPWMCQASARQARQRCVRLLRPKVQASFVPPGTHHVARAQLRGPAPGRPWQCARCCHQASRSTWGGHADVVWCRQGAQDIIACCTPGWPAGRSEAH
jgi:hypothetical protein